MKRSLKRGRRDRREAKPPPLPVRELPEAEQLEEMFSTAFVSMNAHVRLILETNYPESLPLMGADMTETAKRFSDAGMIETLKEAIRQCEEELEALVGVFLLSFDTEPVPEKSI